MPTQIKVEDSAFSCECGRRNPDEYEKDVNNATEIMMGGVYQIASHFGLCDKACLMVMARLTSRVMGKSDPQNRKKLEEHYMLLLESEFGRNKP